MKQITIFILFLLLSINIYASELTGTIAWYNYDKGYGAINPDNKTSQLTFTYSVITGEDKNMTKGTKVIYTINDDRKVTSVTKQKK